MKRLLRSFVADALALCSRAILRKYRPRIVMVTGSVGKTSTKDAIIAALSAHADVRGSEKSYNSEFGVPLTIIGAKNPWSNPFKWFMVFDRALDLIILKKKYPGTLVLEVGADHPGDLSRILSFASPDAVVVTRLPDVPVHVEAYATPAEVREEEFAPASALPEGAPLIIPSRDAHARSLAGNTDARVVRFGFSADAEVRIEEPELWEEGGAPIGMRAGAAIEGKRCELSVRGVIGRPQVLAPAAALALCHALGLPDERTLEGLKAYAPPAGRGRLIAGKNGSTLIDDSYNSSPAAVEEALDALALLPAARKVAVLGDMLELGRYSVAEHERIGRLAAEKSDIVAAVGPRARALAEAARAGGMADSAVMHFETAEEAAEKLADLVQERDAVLVKGSQSMRMERIAEALLADPADAKLLVRQDTEWKKR